MSIYLIFFIIPFILSIPSPSEALNTILSNIKGPMNESRYEIYYDTYFMVFTKNRLLRPILSNIEKKETQYEVTASNITLTFCSIVWYQINSTDQAFSIPDMLFQFNIDNLTLSLNEENNKIILNNLELSKPYIDKSVDIMKSKYFSDFQNDVGNKFQNILYKGVANVIERELKTINK